MADNIAVTAGSGTTIGADDISSVLYQRVKIIVGADGVNDGDISSANPLPVTGTITAVTSITNALPAGTNAIGKLAANSGVDIGDVDVTSIAAGDNNIGNVDIVTVPTDPFGADADAASATGSISAKLRFIASTGIPITGTVTVGSHAVTNAGTFAVQVDGSALTSLQLIDDVVFVDDTATHSTGSTKGIGIMAAATPTDTAVNANDIGMVGMTNNRELYVSLRDIAGATAVTGSGNATGALRVELANNGTGSLSTVSTVTTVSTVSALGVSTTGPQKAEDVASAGGDMGVAIMCARLDTPVANAAVSNDGDYTTPVLDNYRKVWVTGTVPEDTAHVAGEAITVTGARRIDPCATSAGSDADWGTINQSAEGALWVTTSPTTASGLSTFMASGSDGSSILVATAQAIKASAGNLYGYYAYNHESAATHVHFYNTAAASVTVGTTNPLFTLVIPATSAANLMFPYPVSFSNAGWSCAATTTAGGNTAPSTGVSLVAWYK